MRPQADSRKWMACLYNSFLFMEAKIMKMAKKLLAVVLTGVMAMSVLTGCALGDAMAESAFKSELNRLGKTNKEGQTVVETTYEKGTESNDTAKYDLKKALKTTSDAIKALDDTTATTVEAVTGITTKETGAVAFVYEVPSSAKQSKKWTSIADDLNDKLFAQAYMVKNTTGDKATIVINYEIVNDIKVVKDASKNTTEKKDFIVVVAKAKA